MRKVDSMAKKKRKLTAREKTEKNLRRQEFMTIFIHGKMKRVLRPLHVEGMDADEFILRNSDPLWLHQNELWEQINEDDVAFGGDSHQAASAPDQEVP